MGEQQASRSRTFSPLLRIINAKRCVMFACLATNEQLPGPTLCILRRSILIVIWTGARVRRYIWAPAYLYLYISLINATLNTNWQNDQRFHFVTRVKILDKGGFFFSIEAYFWRGEIPVYAVYCTLFFYQRLPGVFVVYTIKYHSVPIPSAFVKKFVSVNYPKNWL